MSDTLLERLGHAATIHQRDAAYGDIRRLKSRKILDLSAGNRAVWFDKKHPDATFIDVRAEVGPTTVADSRALPEIIGQDFSVFIFDPPHANFGANSNMAKSYGHHTCQEIREIVEGTAKEAHRVGTENAVMAFKWNDHDIKLQTVLNLMRPYWEPLVGHVVSVRERKKNQTHWVLLRRMPLPEREES